ncbi:MAG: metal dependent phosphohydrolase [Chthonomonadaceae bacterium]|nr:metal dependent phosphohydrolase [Chthonomonadaceae bacterium]
MASKQFVAELNSGDQVCSCFCVADPQPSNGKAPHRFTLRDKTGDLPAICWPDNPAVSWNDIAAARYAEVTGTVCNNRLGKGLEFTVASFVAVDEPENRADFFPTCPLDPDELWQEMKTLVQSLRNPALRELMARLFRKARFRRAYREAPAAQRMHHPYLGGLLEHSVEVARLCDAMARTLPDLDRDLLVTAALLHDVGKLEEIDYSAPLFASTRSGGMLGHVFLGTQKVYQILSEIPDCPDGLADVLCHLLLSHHGKLEWGAPVPPAFQEAYILHACDRLSVQGYFCRQANQGAIKGALFQKQVGLEGYVFTGEFPWKESLEPLCTGSLPAEEMLLTADAPSLSIEAGGLMAPIVMLPLLGRIAAGVPLDSQEAIEGHYALPQSENVRSGDFLLRISGDSMCEAHILDGDIVHIRPQQTAEHGDIVVALIDGESTVKHLIHTDDRVLLRAANPAYSDILPTEALSIQGKVIGVLRGLF